MAGRPRKPSKADQLTAIQVHEAIKSNKNMKTAAEALGITLAELNKYKYDPTNKKKLDALKKNDQKEEQKRKAELEMGLEIPEDTPIVKTVSKEENNKTESQNKKYKGASEIPLVEDDSKEKINDLNEKVSDLSSENYKLNVENAGLKDTLEIEKRETLKIKAENQRLREQIERLKKNKEEAIEQQKIATAKLNENTAKYERHLNARNIRIEQLEPEVERYKNKVISQNKTILDNAEKALELSKLQEKIEQEHADAIANYEKLLQEEKDRCKEWQGKYHDLDELFKLLENEFKEYKDNQLTFKDDLIKEQIPSEITDTLKPSITPPSHYQANTSDIDPIAFLEMHGTREEVRGSVKINIMKYITRLGRKDDELQEMNKIIDYAQRYKRYLENNA